MGILSAMSSSLGSVQDQTKSNQAPKTMMENVVGVLNNNSPLMRTAATKGERMAASRGLQNSTLGVESAQRAMIDAAMPIAQTDTANAHQLYMQKDQQDFATKQADLDRQHQQGMTRLSSELSHQNAMKELAAQQGFSASQADLDRQHQQSMARLNSDLSHQNAMKELSAQVSANTIGKAIDFVQQITGNFDAQIASVLNNTQMKAEDKTKAINQLKASRDSEMVFVSKFMSAIPTSQKDWTAFPNLGVPSIGISGEATS